jgi:hypothetical protein
MAAGLALCERLGCEVKYALNLRSGNMNMVKFVVLILAIAMVVPTPVDEIVGNFGRIAMIFVGFVVIIWWIIDNDQKKDQSPQG